MAMLSRRVDPGGSAGSWVVPIAMSLRRRTRVELDVVGRKVSSKSVRGFMWASWCWWYVVEGVEG